MSQAEIEKFSKIINRLLKKSQWTKIDHGPRAMAKAIFERLGENKTPKYLDKGSYAEVFWLRKHNKRILKLTTDIQDARAMQRLLDKPQKHLVKVYDVFEIAPWHLYGIVTEKLTPLSYSEKGDWQELWDTLGNEVLAHLGDELQQEGLSERWVDDLEAAIENPDYSDYLDDEEDEEAIWEMSWPELPEEDILEALRNWGRELQKLHIKFYDFHPGNIMTRRDDYILVDLGHGRVPSTTIDPIDFHDPEQLSFKYSRIAKLFLN